MVRADHLGVCHAASPEAFPQGPRQEGLVDREGVHAVPGRVERGGHVLLAACPGPPETAGLPALAEVLCGRVGGGTHVDVGVTRDDHRVSPTEAACRGIHLYVGPERRPSRPRGAACLRPVDVDEGEASPVCADLQGRGSPGDDFRDTEVDVAPFFPSRLLKKGVYPLSRSAAATCISCARVAILVSWSMMAKPPSWGSMPVMRCSLSVQAAGPRRCWSVSRTDRSGGTRPLHRFHERSHRASSAVYSWSQPSRVGIAAGSAGAARAPGWAGAMGCGEPVHSGAHRGARGASPAGMDPCCAAPPVPGADRVPPHRRLRGRPPRAGGARRMGRAMGTSLHSFAGCWRPPPCRPPGLQSAVRGTPGVPALPRLCSTCLHTGGISLVPWPLAPGGAAPTSGWRPLSLVRRAGWLVEPCVVPARGPGPPHRGLVSRARA